MQIRLFGKTITARFKRIRDDEKARLTVRLFDGEDDGKRDSLIALHVTLSKSDMLSTSFEFEPGNDYPLSAHVAVPPAFLSARLDGRPVHKLARWVVDRIPGDMRVKYSGRSTRIAVHDTALWWQFLVDDAGWTHSRPKWRDGSWHPLGHRLVQSEKVIEQREVLVPMPERSYRAKAQLEEIRVGWDKLPRRFDATKRRVKIDMLEGEQVPHPGKGENSWDCDEDATFGMTTPARTIEDGVGRLVASALRSRIRYGGANWKPEVRP